MKKAKSFICMILISMFMLSFSLPAFASYAQPTLEDYQNVARDIIQKYDMEEQMQYQLFCIPHDKNLEEYSKYIEEMAARTAEQYSRMPEVFNNSIASIPSESSNMIRSTPNYSVQPRVMFVDKIYTEYKNYAGWFAMSVNIVVTHNLDYPSYKWISNVTDIRGYCSYAGTLAGYTFYQDVVNTRWFKNDNGSVHCVAPGRFTVTYKGIVEQMGGQIIEGDFGANKI